MSTMTHILLNIISALYALGVAYALIRRGERIDSHIARRRQSFRNKVLTFPKVVPGRPMYSSDYGRVREILEEVMDVVFRLRISACVLRVNLVAVLSVVVLVNCGLFLNIAFDSVLETVYVYILFGTTFVWPIFHWFQDYCVRSAKGILRQNYRIRDWSTQGGER